MVGIELMTQLMANATELQKAATKRKKKNDLKRSALQDALPPSLSLAWQRRWEIICSAFTITSQT